MLGGAGYNRFRQFTVYWLLWIFVAMSFVSAS